MLAERLLCLRSHGDQLHSSPSVPTRQLFEALLVCLKVKRQTERRIRTHTRARGHVRGEGRRNDDACVYARTGTHTYSAQNGERIGSNYLFNSLHSFVRLS